MKMEISLEEKARRYDEAIRESSKIINHCAGGANIPECVSVKATIEQIFPELKESEDERIRKALLNEFIHLQSKGYKFAGLEGEEIIAWLERQDEQNLANSAKTCKDEQKHTPKHKVGDTIYYNSFGDVKSMIVANVTTDSTDNPMYEDENGNIVFEEDLIEYNTAWSEEDKQMLRELSIVINKATEVQNWWKEFRLISKEEGDNLLAWLKSLRPQNRWKPSE